MDDLIAFYGADALPREGLVYAADDHDGREWAKMEARHRREKMAFQAPDTLAAVYARHGEELVALARRPATS